MDFYPLIIPVLAATLRMSFALLVPSLGEAVSERSGVYNVGVEGYMLMGAVASYLAAVTTGNVWFGIVIGMLAGAALSLVHACLSITFKTNQIISGIAIWLFSMGISSFIFRTVGITDPLDGFASVQIPVLSDLPGIGPVIFQQNVLFYIAMLLVVVFALIMFRTRFGLLVRATGENPLAVDMAGYSVPKMRYLSVLITGAMSGFGGAYLPLAVLHRFSENMTAGRGFIALCIVIFGGWNPWGILGGSLLFAFIDALQMQLQAAGVPVPFPLLLMLPYVVTVIVLVGIVGVVRKAVPPRKLAVPYIKGEV
ncbi:MAG: branched-chain amino acid ABC transporter permease [Dehalococcoidales bacterium]|nr:branched-chain amino acid ABC transporter permease [Dehalococcoidales bacterium]